MQRKNSISDIEDFNMKKNILTASVQEQAYVESIKNMSHEEVMDRISKLTTDNYITRQKLSDLEKEIRECEKVLKIECTPENIVAYKKKLDKALRSALKNVAVAEEALLEESKDMPDAVRRQWLEDIINNQINEDKEEVTKLHG